MKGSRTARIDRKIGTGRERLEARIALSRATTAKTPVSCSIISRDTSWQRCKLSQDSPPTLQSSIYIVPSSVLLSESDYQDAGWGDGGSGCFIIIDPARHPMRRGLVEF